MEHLHEHLALQRELPNTYCLRRTGHSAGQGESAMRETHSLLAESTTMVDDNTDVMVCSQSGDMRTRGSLSESVLDGVQRAQSFESGQCMEVLYIDILKAYDFLGVHRMSKGARFSSEIQPSKC